MTDTASASVDLATELTIAWLGNPNTRVAADDVPRFLRSMTGTLDLLRERTRPEPAATAVVADHTPVVSVRKSLASKDHIISMIDGKPYRTLKRHLATNGLTPAEYRKRYKLKADYPMVAENYSESRRAIAHNVGLGRRSGKTPGPATKHANKAPKK